MEHNELKDLGWINTWYREGGKPEVVKKCEEAGHQVEERNGRWNCTATCTCRKCGYKYHIDSSDWGR